MNFRIRETISAVHASFLLFSPGACQLTGKKLCNMGGMTCDDGNVLAYAFDSISIAYAKCTLGEKIIEL